MTTFNTRVQKNPLPKERPKHPSLDDAAPPNIPRKYNPLQKFKMCADTGISYGFNGQAVQAFTVLCALR